MKDKKAYPALKGFLLVFFLVTVFLPLVRMLSQMAGVDLGAMLGSAAFKTALTNSLWVSSVSTLISLSLALVLAWLIERSAIRFKKGFILLFTLPMLIPSISHGMGLVDRKSVV